MIYLNNRKIDEIKIGGACNLQELNVTTNGIYTPEADVEGYNKVTVNVPQSGGSSLDWLAIGYSERPEIIDEGYNYAKQIFDTWDASQTNLYNKFGRDNKLIFLPKIDCSRATDINSMCQLCTNLVFVPELDTSSCVNMNSMFNSCTSLVAVEGLNLSSCTKMQSIFSNSPRLQTIKFNGDPSKITNMQYAFGTNEYVRLADNGTLIYDHRYDYSRIIDELHIYNPTWTAKADNAA